MTTEWITNDEDFRNQLIRGRKTEVAVALDLLEHGFTVTIGKCEIRNNYSDRLKWKEEQDIRVDSHIIEVKSRGISFTCKDDYPYDEAFICSARRWNLRSTKPCCFVIVSEITDKRVVIPTITRSSWIIKNTGDKIRGFSEDRLCAPREKLLHWNALINHLHSPCIIQDWSSAG